MSNFYNHGDFSGNESHGVYGVSSLSGASRQVSWECSDTARANYGSNFTSFVGSYGYSNNSNTFECDFKASYSPSFPSNSCYNTNKAEKRKSGDNMSFVGMRSCADGIVAWGDSKGSIKDKFGNLYLDKDRGNIQKVFKNETYQYLLETFGNNTIFSNKYNEIVHIEDWILENINKHDNPYTLIDDFNEYVRRKFNNNEDYSFFIAFKDKHGYYIQEVSMKENCVIFYNKIYGGYLVNNIQVYAASFNAQQFPIESTCEQFIEDFRRWLLKEIEANNEVCAYNPVGGPIRFETLFFDK